MSLHAELIARLREQECALREKGERYLVWYEPNTAKASYLGVSQRAKRAANLYRDAADALERVDTEQRAAFELVKEASEIMTITYAGNFPAGIESFLIRADKALTRYQQSRTTGEEK